MNDFVNNIFFNNSPDASLIIREGLVCDINLAAERMFGGERNLLIGKPFKMLFSDFQADGRRSDHFIAEIVKNGSSGLAISFECLNRRFDGSDFHTEVSIAQVDLVGEIVLFVCLREYSASNRKTTIYESDNVVFALQESRERFREMADFLPQVVWPVIGKSSFFKDDSHLLRIAERFIVKEGGCAPGIFCLHLQLRTEQKVGGQAKHALAGYS